MITKITFFFLSQMHHRKGENLTLQKNSKKVLPISLNKEIFNNYCLYLQHCKMAKTAPKFDFLSVVTNIYFLKFGQNKKKFCLVCFSFLVLSQFFYYYYFFYFFFYIFFVCKKCVFEFFNYFF